MIEEKSVSITVLLPAGRLPLNVMEAAHKLADKYDFSIYLSTLQNLRLAGVPEGAVNEVKNRLAELGADFKAPDKFPIPRVCVGQGHCNLGLIDTEAVSHQILDKFSDRQKTKAKLKIALSACTVCCSGTKISDIGIVATQNGYDLYVGGKGGSSPKIGQRIAKNADEARMLDIIESLIEFHDKKTAKKQRMVKLLDDPEFPFARI